MLVIVTGVAYAALHVWHFIEHARGNDPDVAHVLLGATFAAILVAVAATSLIAFRNRRQTAAGP